QFFPFGDQHGTNIFFRHQGDRVIDSVIRADGPQGSGLVSQQISHFFHQSRSCLSRVIAESGPAPESQDYRSRQDRSSHDCAEKLSSVSHHGRDNPPPRKFAKAPLIYSQFRAGKQTMKKLLSFLLLMLLAPALWAAT